MKPSTNPYAPPQSPAERLPPDSSRSQFPAHSKVLVATSAIFGGLTTAAAIYLIYVNDPRTGTSGPSLEFAVAGGTALSSLIWAISGWLQRLGLTGLVLTCLVASVSAGLWVGIGGTYADVLSAAACVGWPCGGLAGAICVYVFVRWQHASPPHVQNGGSP